MDVMAVVKRAWRTLWRCRALWVWGVILALTAGSWSAWSLANADDWREGEWEGITITTGYNETFWQAARRTFRTEIAEANRELSALMSEVLRRPVRVNVLVVLAVFFSVLLLLRVAGRIAYYVSETALIRGADRYQETNEPIGVWQSLRLGWSRSAWRIFLINLVVDVVGVASAVLLFGLLFAPIALWVQGSDPIIFLFSFLTGGLFFVVLVAVIVWGTLLSVLKRLAARAVALDGLRLFPAIGRAWTVFTQRFKDVGLAWLVTEAVRWGWRAVMVPVVLALLGVGLLSGSLPGLLVGGATGLVAEGDLPIWLALAVGIPLFFFVLLAPIVFLTGLREVFLSATWTATYRELRALGRPAARPVPAADRSSLEAAPAVS